MMSTSDMGPLDIVIGDIQMCIEKDLFYAALVVALTLPDICAALESEDGWARKDLYKNWYNTYILPKYSFLSAEDCYNLRCSVVHQGKFGRPGMTYSRVLFTLPDRTNSTHHNNILNDALNLDVIIFCNDICNAARDWYAEKLQDDNVKSNIVNLVHYRSNGLAPYMIGFPLIA